LKNLQIERRVASDGTEGGSHCRAHVICSRNKNAHRIFVDVDTCLQLNRFDRIAVSRFFSRQRGSKRDGYRLRTTECDNEFFFQLLKVIFLIHPIPPQKIALLQYLETIVSLLSHHTFLFPPLPKIELFNFNEFL
jgi:hypothetical protein